MFNGIFDGNRPAVGQDKPVYINGFVFQSPPVPSEALANLMWRHSPFFVGRRDGIADLHGDPACRLKAMIEGTARRCDGKFKIARCVVIAIPTDCFRADFRIGLDGLFAMVEEFVRLHADEFRGRIHEEHRGVRYAIVEHDGDPNTIFVMMGSAGSIAGEGEEVAERLSLSWFDEDGQETVLEVPSWRIPRKAADGRVVQDLVPVGIVPGQRTLFLGGAFGRGAIAVPGLAGGDPQGSFFINLLSQDDFAGGCGDGAVLERDGRMTVDPATGVRRWECSSAKPALRPGGQPGRLVVTARPTVAGGSRHVRVTIPVEPRPECGARVFFDVVRLALPRIDGRCALAGLSDYQLAFSAGGTLIDDPRKAALRIGTRDTVPDLFVGSGQGRFDERLATGRGRHHDLPLGGGACLRLEDAPPPLNASYHGFLELGRPCPFALPDGIFTIGRGLGAAGETRLTFGLLAIPGSLSVSSDPAATLEQLALSRRHLTAAIVGDDTVHVTMNEGKAPVYHIDAAGQVLARLEPGTDDDTYVEPGQGLVIGGYVLKLRSAQS